MSAPVRRAPVHRAVPAALELPERAPAFFPRAHAGPCTPRAPFRPARAEPLADPDLLRAVHVRASVRDPDSALDPLDPVVLQACFLGQVSPQAELRVRRPVQGSAAVASATKRAKKAR